MINEDPASPAPAQTPPPPVARRDHLGVAKSWVLSWLFVAMLSAPVYIAILTLIDRHAPSILQAGAVAQEPLALSLARNVSVESVVTAMLFFCVMSVIAALARLSRRRR